MCGIAGIFSSSPFQRQQTLALLDRMTDRLQHRGPDARGTWADDSTALGHRRLSILDLSPAGQQPMHSPSGRFVLVFNGEIYNHLDLRRGLEESHGVSQWRGTSDTETLLCAIENLGVERALELACGMFALALYDRQERRLSLARDRVGEKPLYWGRARDKLVFGSELKALIEHPDLETEICREALSLYLRHNYVPAPWSIYRNCFKLEPGVILTVSNDFKLPAPGRRLRLYDDIEGLEFKRYWCPEDAATAEEQSLFRSDEAALEAVENALRSTIERQMISDVPLGAFLSGGVDSSLVVALMQQQSERPINTFTIGFDASAFDESPYAGAVARHLRTAHSVMRVTDKDAREIIPSLPEVYDEPFADSSQIPTLLVCRAARQKVTVALSGDGGDEMFGGYNRYVQGPMMWNRLSRIPLPARRVLGRMTRKVSTRTWDRMGAAYSSLRPGSAGIVQLGVKAHRIGGLLDEASSFESFYVALVSEWPDPVALIEGELIEPRSRIHDPLISRRKLSEAEWMMIQDLRSYLPGDVLCKVDRAAMHVGLETRAPLLDSDVIRVAARLTPEQKIRNGVGKWALRQVLYRHVPRHLIERPKMGFSVPVGSWLRGPLREWADDLLSPARLRQDGLLRTGAIRSAWAQHLEARQDLSRQLWSILMLQSWRHHKQE